MHIIKKNKLSFLIILIFTQIFLNNILFGETLEIGDKNAKITVKVFSSLTCPHCASFHKKVFENLKREYISKKQVKFEHHAFPLDLAALNAEKIIRCTSSPETKFELLSIIYEKQKKWAVGSNIDPINESLIKIGLEAGIDETSLRRCLKNEKTQELILNERIEAQKKYSISSTPTIYINDKKYEDKHEFKSFKKHIDKLL